jgi:hypothetical protein
MSRVHRLLVALAGLATLPPTLAHEGAHAVAALLAGASPSWTRVGVLQPAIRVEWGRPAVGWAPALVALAPTLAGLTALVTAGIVWLAVGGPLPDDVRTLLVCAAGAAWLGVFALPSGGDLGAALAALDERKRN